ISVGANITGTTSVSLKADGTGNITQSMSAILITTPNLSLQSTSGSIGVGIPINMAAGTVAANTLGSVSVNSAGAITLGPSSGGAFQATAKQITLSGTLSGNTITLKSTNNGGGAIEIDADIAGLSKPKATSV